MKKQIISEEFKRMQFLAGVLNEITNWSQSLEGEATKGLDSREAIAQKVKDLEVLDNPFRDLRKFITQFNWKQNNSSSFNSELEKRINNILTLAKEKGVSEEITKKEIAMQLYTEFFNRGSGSFVRSYMSDHTYPALFNVKKTLEKIGGFDKTNMIILGKIDRWLAAQQKQPQAESLNIESIVNEALKKFRKK